MGIMDKLKEALGKSQQGRPKHAAGRTSGGDDEAVGRRSAPTETDQDTDRLGRGDERPRNE